MSEKVEQDETRTDAVPKAPIPEDKPKFSFSEPDQMDDGDGDWGFSIFADKDVFLASVRYCTQADAIRGRVAMAQALKDAMSVSTSES